MSGINNKEDKGIIPRTIDNIYLCMNDNVQYKNIKYLIYCT